MDTYRGFHRMAGKILPLTKKPGDERNLTQWVYDNIKTKMFNYEIVPGQRLVFNDLAKLFGVSRTPVNNALAILANEGFLDFIHNQGYRVHEITRKEAESLYEIREIIEIHAVGKAIRNATPKRLKILERQKALYEAAVADELRRERFRLDQEFHASIVDMADNVYLTGYLRGVYQRTYLHHRIKGLGGGRSQEVVKEHDRIYRAVEVRDVLWAQELIKSHIQAGMNYIFPVIFG
jgi:DNA-binding GntR family transcriptional regulator